MDSEHSKINNHLSIINNHLAMAVNYLPSSTTVERPLQISFFMQNKANFGKVQMNVNKVITKDYENKTLGGSGKNKANSNPIKPNLRKAKMNVSSLITKDYRKKDDFAVRKNKPKTNPISVKPKMNVNLYVIEDYENETTLSPQKNKPNQSQFQTQPCKNGSSRVSTVEGTSFKMYNRLSVFFCIVYFCLNFRSCFL